MTDAILLAAMVLGSALAVTAHLAIFIGLLRRPPRWRAVVALLAAPAAPVFAVQERFWVRAAAWVLGVVAYVAARVIG
ncbi:MAG: hypothetical protein WKG00_06755 [Polyangiaceae bacterium]